MLTEKICKMCGKQFDGGPRAAYCKECRPKRAKELDYSRRAKTAKRRIGDIDNCQICGEPYIIKASAAKYCTECAKKMQKQRKKQPTKRPLGSTDSCKKCGKKYIVTAGTQRFCPECGKEVHDTASKERKRQQAENNIGCIIKCKYCGRDFVKTVPKQIYCQDCKEIAVKKIDREQGLEYYYKNKDEINPKRNLKRRKQGGKNHD